MSDARGRAFADRLGPAAAPVTVLAIATIAWVLDHGTPDRQRAILFAAAVCLAGGLASWLAALRPATTPAMRVASGLATIVLRLLPALAGLAWLQTSGAALRAAGGSELLVIMYLAALAADLVRIIVGTRRGGRSPGDRGAI